MSVWTEGRVTHRWVRDGRPIIGATSATYVPVRADIGRRVDVLVWVGLRPMSSPMPLAIDGHAYRRRVRSRRGGRR